MTFPRKKTRLAGLLVLAMLMAQIALAPVVQAQGYMQPRKPIMENVFFNVVWGSLWGVMMGTSVAVIESEKKTSPGDLTKRTARGATIGGILGLGVGIYMSFSGIGFDPQRSTFFADESTGGESVAPIAMVPSMPLQLEFSEKGPLKVTGLRAVVLDMKF